MTPSGDSDCLRVLDDLEREHHAEQMDLARILSAAVFVPKVPWWKKLLRRFGR